MFTRETAAFSGVSLALRGSAALGALTLSGNAAYGGGKVRGN